MIIKYSRLPGVGPDGEPLIHLIDPGEKVKLANGLLPEVDDFIRKLRPDPNSTYVLVNAMGYSEFYGANSNADWYGYNSHLDFNGLLHAPKDWGKDPSLDKEQGKLWPYGYPTFYNATVYAHHQNKDPSKYGFGEIIFVAINHKMKRVELVKRIDHDLIRQRGRSSILDRIRHGERVDVSMGTKVPFDLCFHPDTLVRTFAGHKRIQDIQVGERVLTHAGRYQPVTSSFSRASKDAALRIATYGGAPFDLTEEHPLWVVRSKVVRTCKTAKSGGTWRRHLPDQNQQCCYCSQPIGWEPQWVAAKDLCVGDYLVTPSTAMGNAPLGDIDKARLVGYYLGDGFPIRIRRKRNRTGDYYSCGVGFSVGTTATDHLEKLLNTLETVTGAPPTTQQDRDNALSVRVSSVELAQWLEDIAGRGSHGKRLAPEVFEWSINEQLALLGGYLDTDGSTQDGGLRFHSVNRGLLLDVQRLLAKVGIPSTISGGKKKITNFGIMYPWTVCVGSHHAPQLGHYSVKASVLPGDAREFSSSRAFMLGPNMLCPIRMIKSIELPEVHNLTVAGDESFVAEGLAVHNCSICTDWETVKQAMGTFDPKKHLHPFIAVLRYHKTVAPIRGLSVTKADYCDDMKLRKGQILPDGRKVFVYNDAPRFFDNSFVWIGADKTARVMWFMSPDMPSKADILARQSMPRIIIKDRTIIVKTAMEKVAGAPVKLSEMEKEVPGGLARQIRLQSFTEPNIDSDVLEHSSKIYGIRQLLSTLAALGIVLKPGEFQSIITASKPMGDRINTELEKKSCVFDTSLTKVADDFSVGGEFFQKSLGNIFSEVVPFRSSFAPHLGPRFTSSDILVPKTASPVRTDYLDEMAAQYNGYRISILEKAPELFPKYAEVYPLDPDNLLKVSGMGLASLLLGLAPMVHLVSSHLREQKSSGKDLGTVGKFVANNPSFTRAMTIGAGLRAAMGIQAMGGLGGIATKLVGLATERLTGGSGIVQALSTVARAM